MLTRKRGLRRWWREAEAEADWAVDYATLSVWRLRVARAMA